MAIEEGFYEDITAATYHADPCQAPSLSSSIAKILIEKTPLHASQAHPRLNPMLEPDADKKFAVGSVAHELLLGKGSGFEVLDFNDYRSNAAQQARDDAAAAEKTPILKEQFDRASHLEMAARYKLQDQGIELDKHTNELVAVWKEGDAWCRLMADSFDNNRTIYDIKTTERGLSDSAIAKTIVNLCYDLQAAFYIRGFTKLRPELEGRLRWRWIFIEAEAPFEVKVVELPSVAQEIGARKADYAIRKWQHCMAMDEWPGYPRAPQSIELPAWYEAIWLDREHAESMAMVNGG